MDREANAKIMVKYDFATNGLVCQRLPNGTPAANVEWVEARHSPDGYEWGYAGSGPADLALNTLLAAARMEILTHDEARAWYQNFKFEYINPMPRQGGTVPVDVIKSWVYRQREMAKVSSL